MKLLMRQLSSRSRGCPIHEGLASYRGSSRSCPWPRPRGYSLATPTIEMRFLMPSRRKVPEEVRLAIVDAVRHGGRTFDEIPMEYSVSQATVSRIAQAANLSSSHGKRVRSQAGVQADRTYDKEARVGFLDDLLATLQNMTQKSNLSP